jgi:hypothetical protein
MYNVQGMTKKGKQELTREVLRSLKPFLDVICLQEHKHWEDRTARIQTDIWREGHFICAPAEDGLNSRRNNRVIGGRGGVCLTLSVQLSQYVHALTVCMVGLKSLTGCSLQGLVVGK